MNNGSKNKNYIWAPERRDSGRENNKKKILVPNNNIQLTPTPSVSLILLSNVTVVRCYPGTDENPCTDIYFNITIIFAR